MERIMITEGSPDGVPFLDFAEHYISELFFPIMLFILFTFAISVAYKKILKW